MTLTADKGENTPYSSEEENRLKTKVKKFVYKNSGQV